jgi:hypothetical protein
VKDYYENLYKDLGLWNVPEIDRFQMLDILDDEDIESAIKQCNFNKGLGPDNFDGNLLKDDTIRAKLILAIKSWVRTGDFPKYLSEGRLILLSKDNNEVAEVSNTRPIVVLSHIAKVIEKSLVGKLKQWES